MVEIATVPAAFGSNLSFSEVGARFFGPFEIVKKVGQVAYKLLLPESAKIHSVFHVSQLKKVRGEIVDTVPIPATVSHAELERRNPESLLDVKSDKQNGNDLLVLIKWNDSPAFEATWESFDNIRIHFPDFNLEDKVNLWRRSNDKPPIRFTYSRRKK